MPGPGLPWLDSTPPAQWVFGQSGGGGPERTIFADTGSSQVNSSSSQGYDTTLHYKLAGTIALALLTVFVLQQLGFRFVVAAGVGR